MGIREDVLQSQGQILDLLEEYELAMARLYRAHVNAFPEDGEWSSFWRHVTEEEEQHAQFVRMLRTVLAEGGVLFNLARFSIDAVQQMIADVDGRTREAQTGSLTRRQALRNAVLTEASLVESSFYRVVDSDSQPFKLIARHLNDRTEKHRAWMERRWSALA